MDELIGKIFVNKLGYKYKVLYYDRSYNKNRYYMVEFIDSGYKVSKTKACIINGNIKDPFAPSVAGVGYRGITDISIHSREYSVWHNMINRCYNPNSTEYKRYGALGVTVCDRWKCFANFCEDIKYIFGYDDELFHSGKISLDKDYLQMGVIYKIYSLETCIFLPVRENTLIACSKPLYAINNLTSEIMYFGSYSEFSTYINCGSSQVSNTINGRQNTCRGYTLLPSPVTFDNKCVVFY